MKPETTQFFVKAQEDLSNARTIAAVGLSKVAARSAYYAMFHLAEAYIYERSDKVAKTHSGLRAEVARLSRSEPGFDPTFLFSPNLTSSRKLPTTVSALPP